MQQDNYKTLNLLDEIKYVKGIGPKKAGVLFAELNVKTVGDLLEHYPYKYFDVTKNHKISELHDNMPLVKIKGTITKFDIKGEKRHRRLSATFFDGKNNMELTWFNGINFVLGKYATNTEYIVYGEPKRYGFVYSIIHPEIELFSEEEECDTTGMKTLYNTSEAMKKHYLGSPAIRDLIISVLNNPQLNIPENIPDAIRSKYKLISRHQSIVDIHIPKSFDCLKQANRRIKFEEALFFQLGNSLKKQYRKTHFMGNPFVEIGRGFKNFYNNSLPFELTNAQKRVLKEIREDTKKQVQMNRLLQGDVGSGKTIVAILTMLMAIDNGYQACIVAPTEILAQQHFSSIRGLLTNGNIEIKLLTGSTKVAERRQIDSSLRSGQLNILVGTHAILEESVVFKNLGIAIIDEQHRFGVEQRAKLWNKNKIPPHILVMTATPIPRTLAMSFYSDLDVSIIDELPKGRKPIITAHRREKDRGIVYNFVRNEIENGRQVYIVFPLIEESATLDYKNLMEGYEKILEYFPEPKYRATMLHGKMKSDEKDAAMQEFLSGKSNIMVATTVIEVGVDVPNASVMVIESAERFGLSQLHQLRGRVGRGADQSYCILMSSEKMTTESRVRLKTMVETNDGFKISEVDMKLRGPGDILGTRQSGIENFKKLDLTTDSTIIFEAKNSADQIASHDKNLSLPENRLLKDYYINKYQSKNRWGRIS